MRSAGFVSRSISLHVVFVVVFVFLLQSVTMADARPLVQVDKQGEDRSVGVNLPFIYTMDLLTGKRGTGLGLNVLSGLVQVDVDTRSHKAKGRRPVRVSLFGNRLYDSFPVDDSAASEEDKRVDGTAGDELEEKAPVERKRKRNNSV